MTIHLKMVNTYFKQQASRHPLLNAFFALLLLFSTSAHAVDEAAVKEGKALFKANCAACHNPKQNGTGPALAGVTARWEAAGEHQGKSGKDWLKTWIKNWNDPVSAKYPYAVEMSNWAPSAMNLFTSLKDDEIEKILLYVDNSDMGAAPAAAASSPTTTVAPKKESNTVLLIFLALLVVLAGILFAVTKKLEEVTSKARGEVLEAKLPFWKSSKFKVFGILVGLVALGFYLGDGSVKLGRQQGYQPTQPIKYNHELHAGKHKIDCQYCHTSAAKGKAAGIPSLNTCMNCHKNVQSGPEYGTTEIAKIYDAVGWDPVKGDYVRPAKPVEWVRIHNLPDHVYFNHAQHVVAGKVACQSCHGPIQEMKEVYQYAPLSMGWCVNCHRQSEVQFASNNYYSTYEKLHEKLKNKSIDKVTVESIGGTECAKCHY